MPQETNGVHRDHEISARETRILTDLGGSLEAYAQSMRWRNSRSEQVYNIQFRAPIREQGDWLMLVKSVGDEGPLIAFHSDIGLLNCIVSWSSRLNAGRISWRADEYPPSNYDEISAWIKSQLEYVEGFGWD